MSLLAIRFHFTAPVHIGTARADYDISGSSFHSDMLYSAIIHAWSQLGIPHKLLDRKPGETIPPLGFTHSSLFPFFQETKKHQPLYFFPKPIGTLQATAYHNHKRLKKIQYIDTSLFKQLLLNGKLDDIEQNIYDKYLSSNEAFGKIEGDFINTQVSPRVYVPREGEWGKNDAEPFYMERIYFKYSSGFFCLIHFEEKQEALKKNVLAALSFLQDEGLGSDRNTGNGLFKLEVEDFNEFDELLDLDCQHRVNLSLFCPESDAQLQQMLDSEKTTYELMKRGGWITTSPLLNYRKKAIYMFKEGSIFQYSKKVGGEIADLTPSANFLRKRHSIYRVGKSLFLPINI